MPNVGVYVPNNDIYFYLFRLSRTSQIKCHVRHKTYAIIISVLCSYRKNYQPSKSPSIGSSSNAFISNCIKYFQRKLYLHLLF